MISRLTSTLRYLFCKQQEKKEKYYGTQETSCWCETCRRENERARTHAHGKDETQEKNSSQEKER